MIYLYVNPNKSLSAQILETFALGLAKNGVPYLLVRDGKYRNGPAVFYGVQKELLSVWEEVKLRGQEFWWIDNGYLLSKWHGGNYYRVTRNRVQLDGLERSPAAKSTDGARLRELKIEPHPWRQGGRPMIVLQSGWHYVLHGTRQDDWLRSVQIRMAKCGWPEAVIRSKDDAKERIHWDSVSAVVTHSSNVAVDALVQGVPAVCTNPCAGRYAPTGLNEWPTLPRPDRLPWLQVLADNQWTRNEIADGLAWRMLNP